MIAAYVPGERHRLRALASEAALSRVYGGIHYRFDGVAGLDQGSRVAEQALHVTRGEREALSLR